MHGAGFSRCVTLAFMPHSPRITFRADLHRRSCLMFSKSRPGKTPKRPKQDGNQEPRVPVAPLRCLWCTGPGGFLPSPGPLAGERYHLKWGSGNTWRPLQQLVTKDKAPALGSNRGPPLWVHFLEEDTPANRILSLVQYQCAAQGARSRDLQFLRHKLRQLGCNPPHIEKPRPGEPGLHFLEGAWRGG